jgi:hypothetical protein
MTKVHVFKNGTNLRAGGYVKQVNADPDNVVEVIGAGFYEALYQCGGSAVTEGSSRNYWWVKIKEGAVEGWVSAVRIKEGGNDEPVPGVPQRETRYV